MQPYDYWSGTEYSPDANRAWHFYFFLGSQGYDNKDGGGCEGYALAVRPGEVSAVPEPSLMVLLGISMISVAGLRRWWK